MTTRTFSIDTPEAVRPFSKKWRTNVDKASHNGYPLDEGHCCVLCGRKALNATSFVLIADCGNYVTKDEVQEYDLGMFPVGSDCLKAFKKAGIPTYTRDELKGWAD